MGGGFSAFPGGVDINYDINYALHQIPQFKGEVGMI